MRAVLAALMLCAIMVSPARAQTDAEVAACHGDAIRLCRSQLSGWFVTARVLACMLGHRRELSPKCAAVFRAHGL